MAKPVSITKVMASKNPIKAVLPPEYVKTLSNQLGTKTEPIPGTNAAVNTNLSLLVSSVVEIILIPETVTEENKKHVIPPRTVLGMETIAAANFAKMPMMIRKNAHQ